MDDFDLEAARLIRLRQDIDALLPNRDAQTRQDIFRLLSMGTRKGLDLFPRFRAGIAHRQIPLIGHEDAPPVAGLGLEVDILPERQRATLWPYRPHRHPDELLSSWLWRVARGLGAPPRRFAINAIGSRLADFDRDIDDTASTGSPSCPVRRVSICCAERCAPTRAPTQSTNGSRSSRR